MSFTPSFESLQSSLTAFLDGDVPGQISAWLATYLVHGVCLFLLAAIAVRMVKSARIGEQLWRAALFGPLVTASLQLGAGLQPALGHWELPGGSTRTEPTPAAQPVNRAGGRAPLELREAVILARLEELGQQLSLVAAGGAPSGGSADASVSPAAADESHDPMGLGALLALMAVTSGIAALMLRALLEAIRIHRLGQRARLMSGPVVEAVRSLAARAGIQRSIRVEVTRSGSSPYATGAFFPRIVVPERAIQELDAASMQAMLAHEIGHVARFDPLWTAAARSVAALFFFQPLNWLLVKRLDESAEYCCDEFAVDVTGNEVALARCLATVAEWIVGADTSLRAACPMAHRNSPLTSRVHRILATDGEPARPLGPLRWMGGAAIIATAFAAPGFAARATAGETEPKVELAAPAPLGSIEATGFETSRGTSRSAVPFEALELSVIQLGQEIDELIVVAARRDVPESTLQRLRALRNQTLGVHAIARKLQEKASRLRRSASSTRSSN
ncbi:Protease HtpX [Planctomycetes bacterium Poly30]|uniref:Protease HtpX n=1 Tax=Saltatorellus ferox TaxID=2528018 RepID=A0A518F0B5_9BACT|nr:Protease HtpX [Planctomycetes bacterium Poly30]